MKSFRTTLSILILITAVVCTAPAQSQLPPDFDAYVAAVQKQFEVPGIAVAIVKDGNVLLAKGYGLRTIGTSDRVDEETLFAIASNTKAFTATALAMLVEEGKLAWDAPVINYLPWFQLADPYVTREMTVRDLLVHRSGLGLGAGDLLLWPQTTYSRKDVVRRLRYVPLSTSFRSAYAYDNVLYLAAGEVIEAVSGMPWEEFIAKRILDPLAMERSQPHRNVDGVKNVATPHAKVEGTLRIVAPTSGTNDNPAGGILSCAEDIAQWMLCQLDSGRVQGRDPLFTPRSARQLWSIVTTIPVGEPDPELKPARSNFSGYALGFGIRDYRGLKLVSHTGGLSGYVSRVAMIPELRAGVAVFTNQESGEAFQSIVHRVLDHYCGVAPYDWIAAYAAVKARGDSADAASEHEAAALRDTLSHPALSLDRYAGVYRDAWYGDIRLELQNGKLALTFMQTPGMIGDLEHYQYDTFIVRWRDREMRADAYITFSLRPDGSIDQAKMRAVSPSTDFSYDFQDLVLKPVPPGRR